MDECGPSAVSLVMHLLLVHLEVCPVGHVLLSEPWEQGKYPSAFLGTREGSGGLIPHVLGNLCKGAGFQADSSVIQVQKARPVLTPRRSLHDDRLDCRHLH